MTKLFIENLKNPSVRFEVESFDKETKVGVLKGNYGARFTRNLSKESLSKFGYRVVKVEVPDGEADSPKPKKKT